MGRAITSSWVETVVVLSDFSRGKYEVAWSGSSACTHVLVYAHLCEWIVLSLCVCMCVCVCVCIYLRVRVCACTHHSLFWRFFFFICWRITPVTLQQLHCNSPPLQQSHCNNPWPHHVATVTLQQLTAATATLHQPLVATLFDCSSFCHVSFYFISFYCVIWWRMSKSTQLRLPNAIHTIHDVFISLGTLYYLT